MLFSFIASEAFKLDVLLDCLCIIMVVANLLSRRYLLVTSPTDTPVLLVIAIVLREEEETEVLVRQYDVRKVFSIEGRQPCT